jgi:hypothetical protein
MKAPTDNDINVMVRHLLSHGDPAQTRARFWGDHACDQCIKELHLTDSRRPGKKFTCGYHIAQRIAKERGIVA